MKPVLTIIVPVYNTEQYLEKCLDSLLIPQLDKLEVIVVIDGSTDNSLELANKYAARYPDTFKIIDKENGGHGSCCNVGLKLATGKYIRFLDSDDWLDTDTLSMLIDLLENTTAHTVITRSIKEYVYNGTTGEYGYPFDKRQCNQILDLGLIDFHLYADPLFTLAGCTFMTSKLRETKIEFSENTAFDDTIIYTKPFIAIEKILFIDSVLYHYFIGRPDQSVQNLSPEKYCQIFNEIFKAITVFNSIPEERYTKCAIQLSELENNMIRQLYYWNSKTQKEGRLERWKSINNYINHCCRTDKATGFKLFLLKHISSPMAYNAYARLCKLIKR